MNEEEVNQISDEVLGFCARIKEDFAGEEATSVILACGIIFIIGIFSEGKDPEKLFKRLLVSVVKTTVGWINKRIDLGEN